MTQAQFDNGYWYATELNEFAKTIGIPSASRLRKDELEKAIKVFLKAGKIESPAKRSLSTSGIKDVERGLSLSLLVAVYLASPPGNQLEALRGDRKGRRVDKAR